MAPGAKSKFGDPHEGFSEANLLYWRKYLWHCCDFSVPPAVSRSPCSDSAPPQRFGARGIVPPCTPLVAPLSVGKSSNFDVEVGKKLAASQTYRILASRKSITSLLTATKASSPYVSLQNDEARLRSDSPALQRRWEEETLETGRDVTLWNDLSGDQQRYSASSFSLPWKARKDLRLRKEHLKTMQPAGKRHVKLTSQLALSKLMNKKFPKQMA